MSRINQLHRRKPKLGETVPLFNMYVWRLVPFSAEKEEPEAVDVEKPRHVTSLFQFVSHIEEKWDKKPPDASLFPKVVPLTR